MTRVNIYDIEAEKIDALEREHDASEAEIIQALFEALEDNDIDLKDYL